MSTCFFTPPTVETPVQEPAAFFQMGRYGDLILLMPLFKEFADRTGQPTICVTSKQFGTVLEGASYVEPVFMDVKMDWHARAGEALALAKQRFPNIIRTQNHGNGWHTEPDKLPSYSISSWARAGLTLEDYKRLPLVFDQRSPEREALLVRTWKRSSKPLLLLCFDAVTSPLPATHMSMMIRAMAPLWKHFEVVNTNEVRAHRLYDLLGLFDVAAGLVTLDTAPLHLAAASNVPVLNYVRDDSQAGSIPKNNAFATIGYSRAATEIPKMLAVLGGWAMQKNPIPIKTIRSAEPVAKPAIKPADNPRSKYMIGTGYYEKPETPRSDFFSIWFQNTMRHAQPERVVVLANGGSKIDGAPGQWISMAGNLGHAHDLSEHRKPHVMCGWSAAFVTLAMLAYFDECDFIFKEQDALAFGPWVERLYEEIGTRGMIFGDNKEFACSQSVVLIRHAFIPEFVRLYMGTGSEQEKSNECELKFKRLEQANPEQFGRFSFGCDRDRPIPYDAEVFYAQQLSGEELAEMKRRELI